MHIRHRGRAASHAAAGRRNSKSSSLGDGPPVRRSCTTCDAPRSCPARSKPEFRMQNSELSVPPPPKQRGGCQSHLLLWRQWLRASAVKESVERIQRTTSSQLRGGYPSQKLSLGNTWRD